MSRSVKSLSSIEDTNAETYEEVRLELDALQRRTTEASLCSSGADQRAAETARAALAAADERFRAQGEFSPYLLSSFQNCPLSNFPFETFLTLTSLSNLT